VRAQRALTARLSGAAKYAARVRWRGIIVAAASASSSEKIKQCGENIGEGISGGGMKASSDVSGVAIMHDVAKNSKRKRRPCGVSKSKHQARQ